MQADQMAAFNAMAGMDPMAQLNAMAAQMGVPAVAAAPAAAPAAAQMAMMPPGAGGQQYTGTVKFLGRQGYGYIASSTGQDFFFHIDSCGECPPKKDDTVTFNIEPSKLKPGAMQACNVQGGTGAAFVRGKWVGLNVGYDAAMAKAEQGSLVGIVKSFTDGGFGFITANDGTEHFVHVSDCPFSKPMQGDTVAFDVADNPIKPGTTKAVNVIGGTAPIHDKEWDNSGLGTKGKDGKGKGKGKDGKGKGGDDWSGWGDDPMSMMMAMMSSMMEGKGMKGKGKGKDEGKGEGYGAMWGGKGDWGAKGALW
eukprot:gnl/TRDRNA2_/TRDRNA2_185707_c0_seq1.p1 gnl/TRDRNA2_/TRDRNA2_185707_c0~~gnl/TRDRNA2_/TRDRNA2_185707_c0_seq1.p1  ORF type:complete len:331 (-),score=70.83 gnl/TRDRNA2_/TRDRNA2_185707_c0_seq1:155-1078(-)